MRAELKVSPRMGHEVHHQRDLRVEPCTNRAATGSFQQTMAVTRVSGLLLCTRCNRCGKRTHAGRPVLCRCKERRVTPATHCPSHSLPYRIKGFALSYPLTDHLYVTVANRTVPGSLHRHVKESLSTDLACSRYRSYPLTGSLR